MQQFEVLCHSISATVCRCDTGAKALYEGGPSLQRDGLEDRCSGEIKVFNGDANSQMRHF